MDLLQRPQTSVPLCRRFS